MSILNNAGCLTQHGNTGVDSCPFDMKEIVGIIITYGSKVFTASTDMAGATGAAKLATFEAALKVAVNAAGTLRIYPIGDFDDPEVKSTETGENETAFGRKTKTRRGKYNLVSRVMKGGVCYANQLRKFNGNNTYKVFLYTADNFLVGTKSGTAGDIKGVSVDYIHTHDTTLPNGKDEAKTMLEIQFSDNRELNEDIAFIKMSDSINDIVKGIIDVNVTLLSQGAATATVKVTTNCGQVDLYDQFSATLATASGWSITKAGAAVTPVSVAAVPATKSWIITLTTPTGAHLIDLVSAAALDTLGVGGDPDNGFESTGPASVTF